MGYMKKYILFIMLATFVFKLEAKLLDNLFDLPSAKHDNKKINFHNIIYNFNPELVSCNLLNSNKLICYLNAQVLAIFEKRDLSSSFALLLVRLARKESWFR